MDALSAWLQGLSLERYARVFAENGVDLNSLPLLTESDLEKLGMLLGHRRTLLKAIAELRGRHATGPTAHSTPEPTPKSVSAEAERRQLTVMFCDMVGSTALSERLDPEELRGLMQAYQRTCGEVIARYEGHVAQYRGDGLMVYFGWPQAHEDDAVRAIRAGLEVTQALSKLTAATAISARVGIHTGLVVVGETGQGDASIPKAAVGDTPNIAARLQELAEPNTVVVSERTQALAGGVFDYIDLDAHTLKGISAAIHLFRVVGTRSVESRFDATRPESALTPLVGREEEVALLLRLWQEAKEGEGQVVAIGGEPGIGKSRLIRALRERLSPQRYTALRHQCSPYHVNSALYPVIEQLERAAGFTREDTPVQKLDKLQAMLAGTEQQVAESAPLFAALLSLPLVRYPPLNVSPQKKKEMTLEALAGQVEALAERQPVLMIYEDVHWIDATSQEALDLLVPRLQGLPVLLIATYRPEYSPKWAEQAHVTLLGLTRLGRRQAANLVIKVTGGKALPPEVLEQVLAHTDGVPLFMEELSKSILESKLLRDSGDRYVLDGPLPTLAIPTTLRDSLIARLDRLAPVREVAQIGACIGREFAYDLLAAVSPLKGEKLHDALEQLTSSGLLFKRGMPPGVTFSFKHALVQDAAYDTLLKSKRAQLHAQIAEVLEQDFVDQIENAPELLAHHYTQAGNLAAAIPLWRKAGELTVRRVALQEAVGHFQKGLALIEQRPPSRERDELELSIQEPLYAAWVGLRGHAAPEVGMNAAAILQLAKIMGKAQSLLVGLWGIWLNTLAQGCVAESLEWAQRLLAEGNEARDSDLQISGHNALMVSHCFLGHLLEAREHGNRTLALYDPQRAERWTQLTAQEFKTHVGVFSCHWTWILGYPDQAVQVSDETNAHAHRVGHPYNLGWALTSGAYAFDYRCEPERLLERAGEADRLGRAQDIPFIYQALVPTVEGLARLRSGQSSESIPLLRRAIENRIRLGNRVFIPYLKSALAEAMALQGDLEIGLRLIAEGLEQIERPGWQECIHLAEVLRLKGWMLSLKKDMEGAERSYLSSLEVARHQQAKSWELRTSTSLARFWQNQGKPRDAYELLEPSYNWFTEGFDTKDLREARALLEQLG